MLWKKGETNNHKTTTRLYILLIKYLFILITSAYLF